MNNFLNDPDNLYLVYELLKKHETFLNEKRKLITPEVENQKSRFYKFWCWVKYGHLVGKDEDGICLRCGKKVK